MKKADLKFSFDNNMVKYWNLFGVRSKFWGKISFAVLLALFFFVWIKKNQKNQGCFHFLTLKRM
jgi:hypothetical protein